MLLNRKPHNHRFFFLNTLAIPKNALCWNVTPYSMRVFDNPSLNCSDVNHWKFLDHRLSANVTDILVSAEAEIKKWNPTASTTSLRFVVSASQWNLLESHSSLIRMKSIFSVEVKCACATGQFSFLAKKIFKNSILRHPFLTYRLSVVVNFSNLT